MSERVPRSPYDRVGGLVFVPRMLDKIRLHARGELPPGYHNNLGKEFDGHCLAFLRVTYAELREKVIAGGTDEVILEWCFAHGHRPGPGEIDIFNGFMQKAGWRDVSSERLAVLLREGGFDPMCATRFDFIELDEGRTPPDFRKWEPPRP